jgi:hypothetical protein
MKYSLYILYYTKLRFSPAFYVMNHVSSWLISALFRGLKTIFCLKASFLYLTSRLKLCHAGMDQIKVES